MKIGGPAFLLLCVLAVGCAPRDREAGTADPSEEDGPVTMQPGPVPDAGPGAPAGESSEAGETATPATPTGAAARPPSAPPPAPAAEPTAAEPQRVRGRIAVTGSTPMTFVTLQRDGEPSVQLTGELVPELRRLSGAVVEVEGSAARDGLPGPTLAVRSYEVLSIDGQRPHVGTLRATDEGHLLVGAETLRLEALPAALAARDGAKVWIVGPLEDGALRVQTFGVIRP